MRWTHLIWLDGTLTAFIEWKYKESSQDENTLAEEVQMIVMALSEETKDGSEILTILVSAVDDGPCREYL